MRVLLSAFACSPIWGSEPGVGWHWALEIARHHDLVVVTHDYFRAHIEAHAAAHGALPFEVRYVGLAPLRGRFHEQLLNSQPYYWRWQRALPRHVRDWLARERFDVIHHLTWGTFRYPSFLQGMGVPLMAGPLGGGETGPSALYRGLPWRARLKERVRDALIASGRVDPLVRRAWGRTQVLLCRTAQTRAVLPAAARARAAVVNEIGAPPARDAAAVASRPLGSPGELHCLFVGRLLAWKGLHLALDALAKASRQGVDVRLSVIGEGELEGWLRAHAASLGVASRVTWLGTMSRSNVMQKYSAHDVFLFPSIHDSGGTVVLEALSQGCPVVCLDLGGPPHFVDASCGAVVATGRGDPDDVAQRLSGALIQLANDREHLRRLQLGALTRATEHAWSAQVERAYRQLHGVVGASGPPRGKHT